MARAASRSAQFGNQGRYTLSTFGKSLPWCAADAFGLFFLTDVLGMEPYVSGWLLLLLFLWAALCDPAAGWLADRVAHARAAQLRYFRVTTAIMVMAFTMSFLALPAPPAVKLAVIVAGALLFRAAFAALDVPHNALMASLVQEGADPVVTGALRLAATIIAAWTATFAAGNALNAQAGDAAVHFAIYGAVIGGLGGILFCSFLPIIASPATDIEVPQPDDTLEIGSACAPIPWIALTLLFLSSVLTTLVAGIFMKDLVYVAKYVFSDAGWTATAMTAFTLGKLAGIPLWLVATRRMPLQAALAVAYGLSALVGFAALLFEPGKAMFGGVLVLLGLALGGANMLSWSLLALLVGGHPRLRTLSGKLYGSYTALSKVASGLSGLLLGVCLSWLDISAAGASDRADDFYFLACLIPAAGCVAACCCILFCRPPGQDKSAKN